MENFEEKLIKSENIYVGKVFRVTKDDVELSNGSLKFREVVHHRGGVVIVAIKNDKILLVKQFRYPTGQVQTELPAGKLDKEGETVFEAAKRELEEETGHTAKKWTDLGFIWTTPGFCSEKLYLFKAEDLEFVGPKPDEDEILNYFEADKTKVFEMIKSGEINDSKTICAIARAFLI
ncbi:NUDIX hydrolase [bacterium]|nr:NUDIX hydrolase [bacterium]